MIWCSLKQPPAARWTDGRSHSNKQQEQQQSQQWLASHWRALSIEQRAPGRIQGVVLVARLGINRTLEGPLKTLSRIQGPSKLPQMEVSLSKGPCETGGVVTWRPYVVLCEWVLLDGPMALAGWIYCVSELTL